MRIFDHTTFYGFTRRESHSSNVSSIMGLKQANDSQHVSSCNCNTLHVTSDLMTHLTPQLLAKLTGRIYHLTTLELDFVMNRSVNWSRRNMR